MRDVRLLAFAGGLVIFSVACGSGKPSDTKGKAASPSKNAGLAETETEKEFEEEGDQTLVARPNSTPPKPAKKKDPRLAAYALAEWPAATARRDGVKFLNLSIDGWTRTTFQVDPRRGQATLGFGKDNEKGEAQEATLFLTLRLHEKVAEARQELMAALLAVSLPLQPEAGIGDVAFGRTRAKRLIFVAAVRGNVFFKLRSTRAGEDLTGLVGLVDQTILASPVLAAKASLTRPKVTAFGAGRVVEWEAAPLNLQSAKDAPKPEFIAFECTPRDSTSVVRNGDVYEVSAGKSGNVTVKAYACSDALQTATFQTQFRVLKRD